VVALAMLGLWASGRWAEEHGRSFLETGRAAVRALDDLAAGLASGEPAAIERRLDPGYSGARLGLAELGPAERRDGVAISRFRPGTDELDRTGAIREWLAYLDGFDAIERIELHLDRVESWSTGWTKRTPSTSPIPRRSPMDA